MTKEPERELNSPREAARLGAALIDMDGVLYDSMPGHCRAWRLMFEEIGLRLPEKEFFLYEGMTGGATIDLIFKRELNKDATEKEKKELYHRKTELFNSLNRNLPMKGASKMLFVLRSGGMKTVLVTGSGQKSLLGKLSADYPGCFPVERMVTANDVINGKPDPEPYLKGALKAGLPPSNCMAIENAPLGVRSAKAAGCFTIAVTTGPIPREEFEKEGADIIFPSMPDFATWLEKEWLPLRGATLAKEIDETVEELQPSAVVVVTDINVQKHLLPLLSLSKVVVESPRVILRPGEENKDLRSVKKIWEGLEKCEATRKSLIVNIGGGMVTDIGGFAAATFKRGIRYINVPTTLLGAVDAATGGKTGINFNGYKNEIGAFHKPSAVIISSLPINTLSRREALSGYAEMLKTALIADAGLYEKLRDVDGVLGDAERLERALKRSVDIKREVTETDPFEKGLRKILNFGHTAGHAFESLSFLNGDCKESNSHDSLPHGFAVAHGMLVELILSMMLKGLARETIEEYASLLKEFYGQLPIPDSMMGQAIEVMGHDKKNEAAGKPNFTLLEGLGEPVIDCCPEIGEIEEALAIYQRFF